MYCVRSLLLSPLETSEWSVNVLRLSTGRRLRSLGVPSWGRAWLGLVGFYLLLLGLVWFFCLFFNFSLSHFSPFLLRLHGMGFTLKQKSAMPEKEPRSDGDRARVCPSSPRRLVWAPIELLIGLNWAGCVGCRTRHCQAPPARERPRLEGCWQSRRSPCTTRFTSISAPGSVRAGLSPLVLA